MKKERLNVEMQVSYYTEANKKEASSSYCIVGSFSTANSGKCMYFFYRAS